MTPAGREARIRLGIVGCGAVAQVCHLKALDMLPQFEVAYLCDRNVATAQTAKSIFGLKAKVTDQIQDFAGNVDAAIVCVWPSQHRPVTLELLDMGLDVLCEKPTATTSADARAIVEAAERSGRTVAIGHWCRCLQNIWNLRRLLAMDYFGEVESVTAEFGNVLDWPMSSGAYFDREVSAGGVMFEAGIHVLDLVVWMFGGIDNLRYEDDSFGGVESNGVISGTLTIKGRKVPCRVGASWTHALSNSLRLRCSAGDVTARLATGSELTFRHPFAGEQVELRLPHHEVTMPFGSANFYAAQLENFATILRTREPPITPVASTILPIELIEQAYAVRQPMAQPWVDAKVGQPCLIPAS
jgi:predicted dehydrogenase